MVGVESKDLVEKMTHNEYHTLTYLGAKRKGVLELNSKNALMACHKVMVAEFEPLTKQSAASSYKPPQVEVRLLW